jgi:hypothetical protein
MLCVNFLCFRRVDIWVLLSRNLLVDKIKEIFHSHEFFSYLTCLRCAEHFRVTVGARSFKCNHLAGSIFLKILSLRCSPDLYPLLYLYIAHWSGVAAGCLSPNLFASFYKSAGNFRCSTCPTGFRIWFKLRLNKNLLRSTWRWNSINLDYFLLILYYMGSKEFEEIQNKARKIHFGYKKELR